MSLQLFLTGVNCSMVPQGLATQMLNSKVQAKQLSNPSYVQDSSLWHKEKHFYGFSQHELSAKRHPFVKMGKILGLETRRFIAQWQGHLFYFDSQQESSDYLGFCDLQNVYVQWFCLSETRYVLLLSNGSESSAFYFTQPTFWQSQEEQIAKYCVQLNFSEKYAFQGRLGSGSFSEVQKVKQKKSGEYAAAKVISKVDKKETCTKKMASSQRKILHLMREQAGICPYRQFFQTQKNFILVLDFLPGVTLMDLLEEHRQLEVAKIKNILKDILKLIKQCHQKNIIHRDLKPQNIILSPRTLVPKLVDFGLALMTSCQMQAYNYCKCGTLAYTAPEVLLTDSIYYKTYSYKCDIFSFGIIAHLLLLGYNPLLGKTEAERKKNINLELKEEQIVEKYGEGCLTFLRKLTAGNPKHRYSADEALKCSFLKEDHQSEEICSTRASGYYSSRVPGLKA